MPSIQMIGDHSLIPSFVKPGAVVLDLGTNNGAFAFVMRDRFKCSIVGYEPVPYLHQKLYGCDGLNVYQKAVGGIRGEMMLHIYADKCASLAAGASEALESVLKVDVVTLADAIAHVVTNRVAVLKVDIEGAELAMFDAASDSLLQRFEQITVEFHDWMFPETKPHVERLKIRLRRLGFRVLKMSRTNGDVLFVNASLLPFNQFDYLWGRFGQKYLRGAGRILARWSARLRDR